MKITKWEVFCIIVAVFQPVLGIVGGYVLHTEKRFKKSGKIVMLFSVLWLAALLLVGYYTQSSLI
jgi:hypothetical protein